MTRSGYRFDELASAFDRIMDPRDWKAPIETVIPASERQLVAKAIHFFTGSYPEFEAAPEAAERLLVRAPGYRSREAGGEGS